MSIILVPEGYNFNNWFSYLLFSAVKIMGQANSSRERHKSGDVQPCSPGKDGQAFVFDKKPNKLLYQTSADEDDFLNTKVLNHKDLLKWNS